ncbi:MAG: aminotransferase class V-fold PLP-dependent enzyme [Micromonosporaceae bacterium]
MNTQFTPGQFRALFPGLADTVHLASCSQGALSGELLFAMQEYLGSLREQAVAWDRWMGEVETARSLFADLIGARADEVAVLSNASEAAYQVASSLRWDERPTIVTTDMEFPSVANVWLAQRPLGAKVRHVPDRDGVVEAEDYVGSIDETTHLVSVPLVSYRNGARMPVQEVVARAREVGARVFVDAYQAAGVLPVDVREIDCDYLVSGALKYLLGLPGIAFLYVRNGTAAELEPRLTGWFGQREPFGFDPRRLEFADTARRFETGTPAIASAYGAVAGLRTLAHIDRHAGAAYVRDLVDEAHARLVEAGERTWSPADPDRRGPLVALVDDDPVALGRYLAARRIVVSPRGHVARISFHAYNNREDIDVLLAALADYRAGRAAVQLP